MMDDKELQSMLEEISAPESLAGEDWSDSWIPSTGDQESTHTTEATEVDSYGSKKILAGTDDVQTEMLKREAKLKKAKTEEERQMIIEDTSTVNITLAFTKDQAVIVRGVLGDHPAVKLYEICQNIWETEHGVGSE
jgi:hypothetical protein